MRDDTFYSIHKHLGYVPTLKGKNKGFMIELDREYSYILGSKEVKIYLLINTGKERIWSSLYGT